MTSQKKHLDTLTMMRHIIIAVVFILFIQSVAGDDPVVRITNTDPEVDDVYGMIIQVKRAHVQLTCTVENQPPNAEVQWHFMDRSGDLYPIQLTTSTKSIDAFRWAIDKPAPTSWRLRIDNVQVKDEGIYTCKVQVVDQSFVEDSRELIVVEKPEISSLETTSDITKNADSPVTLECYATGRPTPIVKWMRLAGESLPSGGTEFQGNLLTIDRVQSDHAGIYKCTASNFAGSAEWVLRMRVKFRPEITAGTPNVMQKVGYVIQLVCNIKGYPPPQPNQIAWRREGQPLISDSRVQIRNIAGASNRITSIVDFVGGVQSSDFGRYVCSADNEKGGRSLTLDLIESDTPRPDRTGKIRNKATSLSFNILATIFMVLSVCLFHRL